jgi:hypothetical protein
MTIRILSAENRSRILGRNPDKSLKSFPPCYSQPPLHALLYFVKLAQPLTVYVKEKGGNPYPLPYGFRNPYRDLESENSHEYPQKP